MHLDLQHPVALAGLAPAALDVETEAARAVTALARGRYAGIQLADRREHAGIGRRVRTRSTTNRTLVDIDNFKSINDTWGHLNGDIVLRNVAREGLQVLQPLEISLYRYGGEEFAVVFPAEHIDNARTLLETWRVNVERRTWREDGLTVTFSAGLGEWNMEPLDKLVVSVDEALYKAKQQGKNRILRA